MIINTNMNALAAHRSMSSSLSKSGKAMEKLSSGFKINKGSDDAAGLSISEKMRAQIRGLNQASNNAQNAVSLLQTAEGALTETQSMLHRMRELAVQGATETNTAEDNAVLDKEFQLLKDEINRSADTTQFNKKNLINGTLGSTVTTGTGFVAANGIENFVFSDIKSGEVKFATVDDGGIKITATWTDGSRTITEEVNIGTAPATDTFKTISFDKIGITVTLNENISATSLNDPPNDVVTVTPGITKIQVGANANQTIEFSMRDMTATGKVLNLGNTDVLGVENSQQAIKDLDAALTEVSMERATIGAVVNRMEYTVNNLSIASENLTSAESRIRDTDMAKEMMTYSKFSILQQASQAMIAQANQQPQGVLQLLR